MDRYILNRSSLDADIANFWLGHETIEETESAYFRNTPLAKQVNFAQFFRSIFPISIAKKVIDYRNNSGYSYGHEITIRSRTKPRTQRKSKSYDITEK